MRTSEGLLVVFSGPSGAGKDTILRRLLEKDPQVRLSVSATTRAPRPGEQDGRDYFFMTRQDFDGLKQKGGLLENAEYCGNCYGTPAAPIAAWNREGYSVVLEIEVQGAAQVMRDRPDCVSIFVLPPSLHVLEKRLRDRKTENEETIQKRLAVARREVEQARNYDYVVVNDALEDAVDEISGIIRAEQQKTKRNLKLIEEVLKLC